MQKQSLAAALALGMAATAMLVSIDGADATSATCGGHRVTIRGYNADDTLYGTDGSDVIDGGGGKDTIYGYAGNDIICGGKSDDTIYGGPGNDRFYYDAGKDTISGEGDVDTYDASKTSSEMVIMLGAGKAFPKGASKMADALSGIENAHGGSNNDDMYGTSGANELWGNAGVDRIYGRSPLGTDRMHGGSGNPDLCYWLRSDGRDIETACLD